MVRLGVLDGVGHDVEENLFKKFKKIEKPNNIVLSVEEKTNESRIENLEIQVAIVNDKISKILQILENK